SPPWSPTDARRIFRWSASASPYLLPRRLSSCVDPSMSVKRKVTVPVSRSVISDSKELHAAGQGVKGRSSVNVLRRRGHEQFSRLAERLLGSDDGPHLVFARGNRSGAHERPRAYA